MRNDGLYIALCVVGPLVWGVLSARLFDWWEARRPQRIPAPKDDNEDMYYI